MIDSPTIVEGADTLGKTNLIGRVLEADSRIVHERMGLEHAEWGPRDWLRWAATTRSELVDRSHLSEVVYGLVCRDGPRLNPVTFGVICGVLQARGFKMFLAYAEDEVYDEILEKRYDPNREAFSPDLLMHVNFVYRSFATSRRFAGYTLEMPLAVHKVTNAEEYLPPPGEWDRRGLGALDPVKVRGCGDRYLVFTKLVQYAEMLEKRVLWMHDNRGDHLPDRRDMQELRTKVDEINRLLAGLEQEERS